jgi:hypothetical protein
MICFHNQMGSPEWLCNVNMKEMLMGLNKAFINTYSSQEFNVRLSSSWCHRSGLSKLVCCLLLFVVF